MPNTERYSGQAGPIHADRAYGHGAVIRQAGQASSASAWLKLMTGPSADSSLASTARVHTVAAQNAWISSGAQGPDLTRVCIKELFALGDGGLPAGKPRITIGGQLAELVRHCFDGWRGVGV